MMFVDPDGEFWHLIIGGLIGGISNWAFNGCRFDAQGLGYFGVGALAGAVGAGIGAGVSSSIAGTSFAAGFMGSSGVGTATSSFLSGAAIGGSAGGSGGFLLVLGNGLLDKQSLGQALVGGLKGARMGALTGGVLGGLAGGIDAALDGRRFFDGARIQDNIVVDCAHPYVPQQGEMNCGPSSSESLGNGCFTQHDVRATLGGDPKVGGLREDAVWNDFASRTGRTYKGPYSGESIDIQGVGNYLKHTGDIAISTKGNTFGHSVVANRVTERTITKISGKVVTKMFLDVMDPGRGQYIRMSPGTLRSSNINLLKY